MACGTPNHDSTNANPGSCSTSCWNTSSENNSNKDDGVTGTCNREGSERLVTRGDNCNDGCTNGCAKCYGNCTASCDSGCGGACSSGCSGCQGCGGACSSNCSGCTGQCKGGCQGNCNNKCNVGCTNEEQVNNAKVTLDRIVNVNNVKDIFKFIIYEGKRRNKSINTNIINQLSAWTPENEAKLFLLYYTLPRLFEDTLKALGKEVQNKQSATLQESLGEWISVYLNASTLNVGTSGNGGLVGGNDNIETPDSHNPEYKPGYPDYGYPTMPINKATPYINHNKEVVEQGIHGYNQTKRPESPYVDINIPTTYAATTYPTFKEMTKEEIIKYIQDFLKEIESMSINPSDPISWLKQWEKRFEKYWEEILPYIEGYFEDLFPEKPSTERPTPFPGIPVPPIVEPEGNTPEVEDPYIPTLTVNNIKHYADKVGALEWISKAKELYNEMVPVNDQKG